MNGGRKVPLVIPYDLWYRTQFLKYAELFIPRNVNEIDRKLIVVEYYKKQN